MIYDTLVPTGACNSMSKEHKAANLKSLADHSGVAMMFDMTPGASTVECKGNVFEAKLAFKAAVNQPAKDKAKEAFTKDTRYELQLQTSGATVPVPGPFVSAEMRDEEQKGTPVTQANGDGGDTSDSTGVIVGVVVAMIILLCVGVAGFVMYKRSSDEAVRSSLKHHSRTRGNDNRAGQFFLSPFF